MRIAFLSDIHSNLVALDAVLADLGDDADRIICLGDIVDLGPQPLETVHRLQELGCDIVAGNHDPLDEEPFGPHLQAVQDWTIECLDRPAREFIASLRPSIWVEHEGMTLLCVHGSPRSCNELILADTPEEKLIPMLGDRSFDILASGHTHVQMARRFDQHLLINAGSVGMPFERPFCGIPPHILPWAEYAVLELSDQRVSVNLRRVAYDFERFRQSLHSSGIPAPQHWMSEWEEGTMSGG